MKKSIIYLAIVLGCGLLPQTIGAQKYAVKVYGDIGIGKGMSLTTGLPDMTTKSSSNAFGVDFGYTFFRQGGNSLEANIGVGYRMASATFDVESMNYNYSAPASADQDGNPYQRFTSISDMNQKIDLGYFNIPIYLQYQYHINKWLGVHADLGIGIGFKCTGKVGSTTGIVNSYGVYPQYDDLVIKAEYLNDFGEKSLDMAKTGESDIPGFSASVMAGAGFEFYVSGPVSIDLGIRYNAGLTNVFTGHYEVNTLNNLPADAAPVTYTVSEGQHVKAMSDYITKSRMNPLSLHIGVNLRF